MKDLQALILKIRSERGFTTDPIRMYALLNEEVGEVGGELKRTWSPNYDEFDPARLADELADTMVLTCALASEFNIDLESAIRSKFVSRDSGRVWASAKV